MDDTVSRMPPPKRAGTTAEGEERTVSGRTPPHPALRATFPSKGGEGENAYSALRIRHVSSAPSIAAPGATSTLSNHTTSDWPTVSVSVCDSPPFARTAS